MPRSLAEGFATWVEERVAASEFGLGWYPEQHRAALLDNHRMEYVRGRDFCATVAREHGVEAVFEAMRQPPALPVFARTALKKPGSNAEPAGGGGGGGERK